MKKSTPQICFPMCLFIILMLISSCGENDRFRYEEGFVWNTVYHISYESERSLTDSIIEVFNNIDSSLSAFNPESTVSKINDNRSTNIDSLFAEVYRESVKINRASSGAFDPTLAPLIRAWGFGQGHEVNSDTLRLDSLLSFVGISKTWISGGELVKEDPRIEFNFSALAKGYGVDCVADMLERNGVSNYLVEIGGEIRLSGHNSRGEDWCVGIDRPEEGLPQGETVLNIVMSSGAIATSGNYRNFQESGGNRFGHTLSAVTGRPVKTDVISATVVAPACMEADALATTCMAIGKEKALDLCNRLRAGVMLVCDDMSVVYNPVFGSLIRQ